MISFTRSGLLLKYQKQALLALANRLADSQLKYKARLELIDQMRSILDGKVRENVEKATA